MDLEKISADDFIPATAPREIVTKTFSRCSNWPTDPLGIEGLTEGLAEAVKQTGIPGIEIVKKCAELSDFCPTDHNLIEIAWELKAERSRQTEAKRDVVAEWKKQYGEPKPWEIEAEAIMAQATAARQKRETMEKHIHAELKKLTPRNNDRQNIDYSTWFRMQQALRYPLTPEQRKYI